MTDGFDYPELAHQRRHGPQGYAGYHSDRPWLRDEFEFRGVYCLIREQWGAFPVNTTWTTTSRKASVATGRMSTISTCTHMVPAI